MVGSARAILQVDGTTGDFRIPARSGGMHGGGTAHAATSNDPCLFSGRPGGNRARRSCSPRIKPLPGKALRSQQPAARPAQAPQQFPPGAMDELLRQWEEQSAKLKTLEVDIYRTDQDRAWGDEAQFSGHAAFKSPDLAFVDYKKVKLKSEPNPKDKNQPKFVPAQGERRQARSQSRSKRSCAPARRSGTIATTSNKSSSGRSARMRGKKPSTKARCRSSSG